MYIGFMYSMCAFGPVCGFLLGAYLLSHHVDTFTWDVSTMLNIGKSVYERKLKLCQFLEKTEPFFSINVTCYTDKVELAFVS